ncbi:MAG: rod shape-determining protein RodA [Acidimicrobiia bacterium]|nr:rod shape-determining protein RodA [Acidimicrobiia bacterium]
MMLGDRSRSGVGGILEDRPRPVPDVLMFLIIAGLMALGSVMIYSSTYIRLDEETGDPGSAMRKQLVFAVAGLVTYLVCSMVDYRLCRRFQVPIYICLMLALFLVLFASPQKGATRWIPVGPFQFQPSEFAKVALIVVLAALLAPEAGRLLTWKRLGRALLAAALPGFLIFRQPDLGTMLVVGFITIGMLFVARSSIRQMLVLGVAGVVGAFAMFQLDILRSYQANRLSGFFDQTADLQGVNWNLNQSQIAIGSGQLFGRGLFQGTQTRLSFIPSQTTDFIFTAVGEQFGFIGSAAVILAYAILIWRVLIVAIGSPNAFGTLISVGMASLLSFHVFVNIGMTVGLVPVTGLPLPFMSAGGSAMIAMSGGLGIVNSVWRSRSPVGEREPNDFW